MQSLYLELDMLPTDAPVGVGGTPCLASPARTSAAAALAVAAFAEGAGLRPAALAAAHTTATSSNGGGGHSAASKAANKWVRGALGRSPEAPKLAVDMAEAWLAASLQRVGELFKEMAEGFKVYADYVAWHMAGSKLLVRLRAGAGVGWRVG